MSEDTRIARIEAVVLVHMLTGPAPGQCRCGWGQEPQHLGKSHPEHVARMLDAALPEADRDEVAGFIYTEECPGGGSQYDWNEAARQADYLLSRYHMIPKGTA